MIQVFCNYYECFATDRPGVTRLRLYRGGSTERLTEAQHTLAQIDIDSAGSALQYPLSTAFKAMLAMTSSQVSQLIGNDGEHLQTWLDRASESAIDHSCRHLLRTSVVWLPQLSSEARQKIFRTFCTSGVNAAQGVAVFADRLRLQLQEDPATQACIEAGICENRRHLVAATWFPQGPWYSHAVSPTEDQEVIDVDSTIRVVRSVNRSVASCTDSEKNFRQSIASDRGRLVTFRDRPVLYMKRVGANTLTAVAPAVAGNLPLFPGVMYGPDTSTINHLKSGDMNMPYELTAHPPLQLMPIRSLGTAERASGEVKWRRFLQQQFGDHATSDALALGDCLAMYD